MLVSFDPPWTTVLFRWVFSCTVARASAKEKAGRSNDLPADSPGTHVGGEDVVLGGGRLTSVSTH